MDHPTGRRTAHTDKADTAPNRPRKALQGPKLPAGMTLRGRTYYAERDVPRPLQAAMGKRRLVKSLGRDLHRAKSQRHLVHADFQRIIDEAEGRAGAAAEVEAGLTWRRTFAALERGDPGLIRRYGADGVLGPDGRELTVEEAADFALQEEFAVELDSVAQHIGPAAAVVMRGLAEGKATPLLHYLDAWLAEGGAKGPATARTQQQYRSDLNALADWLRTIGVTTLEAVTKKAAGRYVTEALVGQGMNRVTANRKISAPSAYWRWLLKRTDHVEANPWTGQSLAKGGSRGENGKTEKHFTVPELAALFAGERLKTDVELADAMHVAALTGARLDELYRLTVADCADGWFRVRVSKTGAGVRRVPIHTALAALVARRTAGRTATAFLFHEAPVVKGRERSAPLSKRFGRYRQTVGVHARAEGRRHSTKNFHSFRHTFVTMARNAGFDRAVVGAVVGHKADGITDGVYHGGPSDALKVACVEAVRLP